MGSESLVLIDRKNFWRYSGFIATPELGDIRVNGNAVNVFTFGANTVSAEDGIYLLDGVQPLVRLLMLKANLTIPFIYLLMMTYNLCLMALAHFRRSSMRSMGDPTFTPFVDRIGEDCSGNRQNLAFIAATTNFDNSIDFLFPEHITKDPETCLQRAFLSPLNIHVDEFNDRTLEKLPGEFLQTA